MHELSIATSLMDQLLRIAEQQQAGRIVAVEVQCGLMRQVVPEALRLAFEAVSADTVAAGARLDIVEEKPRARCRPCGQQFDAAINDYLCPRCAQADVEIIAGRDILLKSVVCETDQSPGGSEGHVAGA